MTVGGKSSDRRPRLLDLYCGAGGAAVGYDRAGFEVLGVDIVDQPNYPFAFRREDALDFLAGFGVDLAFDAIHASPPCQAHVRGMNAVNVELGRDLEHVDHVAATRELLVETDLPFVIENVVGAPLVDPITLCGTSFGLPLRRHRLFESNVPLLSIPCRHSDFTEKRYWNGDRSVRNADGTRSYTGHAKRSSVVQIYGHAGEKHEWPAAMEIDWMSYPEMTEAIPPAFTEYVGAFLIGYVGAPA